MSSGSKSMSGGAMGPNQVLELIRKANEALSKAVDNEKRIIELEKTVNDKNHWNNTVRSWIDSKIELGLLTGTTIRGVLKAVDRYTLLILAEVAYRDASPSASQTVIVHKGAIATITQLR